VHANHKSQSRDSAVATTAGFCAPTQISIAQFVVLVCPLAQTQSLQISIILPRSGWLAKLKVHTDEA